MHFTITFTYIIPFIPYNNLYVNKGKTAGWRLKGFVGALVRKLYPVWEFPGDPVVRTPLPLQGAGVQIFHKLHHAAKKREKGRKKKRKLSPVSRPNPFLLPHPKAMDGYVKIYF